VVKNVVVFIERNNFERLMQLTTFGKFFFASRHADFGKFGGVINVIFFSNSQFHWGVCCHESDVYYIVNI
jgi:hypothetical protein